MAELLKPDFSEVTVEDLAAMMIGCAMSGDQSDKQFAIWCREEISRRKPAAKSQPTEPKGASHD